ncbi:MAG TPA: phosphoenolpyruvate mutase [Thiotrichaceae bacterium]|jgi:phosphoenolpyruvate phosphomutase|nr:phosphoenolpyruvate mutase [Thiotrichaceae bacterium]HIM07779.1 phosphoenolpyruvate mutase [Gammaproteobacteria bacterium]
MAKISPKKISKCKQLRSLLESGELEFILEAHNGVSASIVERAGFKGIWGSGLALSAQFGVRDSNEASWTQVVDMLEFMSDATSIPILLDGDTGYGNFNNMRRLVKKLEQRDIAGVCIEDKQFPKTNSFIDGNKQPIAEIDEFCGKIKAGKDSQTDDDFTIIARIEALIAGWGMDEALKRAEAYHQAGADGILIHSKLSRPDEILTFAKEWAGRSPLVIVPTKYYSTPTEAFRKAGIDLVIWANHMVRSSIASMEKISQEILESESIVDVEDRIATVDHIFNLQGAAELSQAQERYLSQQSDIHAIILAASRGSELHELTHDKPKAMISIGGKTLLGRLMEGLKKAGINKSTVIAGYQADSINLAGIEKRINKDFETASELSSLICAQNDFNDDMVVVYGDLLFREYILRDLLETKGEIVVVVDSALDNPNISGSPDYAYCSQDDDRSPFMQDVTLTQVSSSVNESNKKPSGYWIGMMRVRKQGREWIESTLDELKSESNFNELTLPDLLNHLIQQGKPVNVHYIDGHWLDVNSLDDINRAGNFTN